MVARFGKLVCVAVTAAVVGSLALFGVSRGCVALDARSIDVGDSVMIYDTERDLPAGGGVVVEDHGDGTVTIDKKPYGTERVKRTDVRPVNTLNRD